jgi:hypothetical protein
MHLLAHLASTVVTQMLPWHVESLLDLSISDYAEVSQFQDCDHEEVPRLG